MPMKDAHLEPVDGLPNWRRRALAEIRLRLLVEQRAQAWQAVARNLAQAIETEHGTGIASLRQQMLAHGLTEEL